MSDGKPRPKKKKAPAAKTTPETVAIERAAAAKARAEARVVDDWRREQETLKQYEAERPDLAPWVGWEEYSAARANEQRIKAVGMVGAIMRGEKRSEIRKKWRISPGKLNAILNSETVDNVLAYSLGYIYSFQTACVKAILHRLTVEHDGHLALALLEKMGLFTRQWRIMGQTGGADGESKPAAEAEDVVAFLLSRGDSVSARQVREAIERFVVESVKKSEG